jgi:hypothetical protein
MTTQGKSNGFDQPSRLPEPAVINPKDAIASAKPDLSLVTRAMAESIAAALQNGVVKYGRNNWRSTPVRALVYTAAVMRHIKAYEDGEDVAADSGVHHLDHAIASLCIMRDAAAFGTLVDNRELGTRLAAAGPYAPAKPAKRYAVFYRNDGQRSKSVSADFASKSDAERAASESYLGSSFYFVKELDQ